MQKQIKSTGVFFIYRDEAGLINYSLGSDYEAIPPGDIERIAQLVFKNPKLTGEQVTGYKVALTKISLRVTTELAPAIAQDDPVTIATILDIVTPVITEIEIIIDTTSDSDVKKLGAEVIKHFEWYSESFTIADLDMVRAFKRMLYVFFIKANTTFKKRIRFEIPVHQA